MRTAIVTGAAQGIGRQVATQLHEDGLNIVVVDIDGDLAASTAAEIGSDVMSVRADVSDRAQVREVVERCVASFGGVDVMIAHAGIAMVEPFMSITDAAWQRMLDVNVNGAFICIQEAARAMIADNRHGSIVVTCSTNSFWAESNAAHYNTSKGAVAALIRSAALDLAPHRIRVNGVDPGLIRTRLTTYVTDDPQLASDYLSNVPLGRFGQPSDVAEAICFLASERAQWVTGQRICVDGGQTLGTPLPVPEEAMPGWDVETTSP